MCNGGKMMADGGEVDASDKGWSDRWGKMAKGFSGGPKMMADGGEVDDMGDDDKALMDHVALECMHAIEMKDKEAFLESLHVLIAHICMSMDEGEGEQDVNG